MAIANHKWRGNCLLLSVSHCCLPNLSKSKPLVQLFQVIAACPSQSCLSGLFVNDCLSKVRLLVQINGHLPKPKPLVQVKAALLEVVCPRQGHFSKAAYRGCCQWPLAQAKATRPSQGHLSKARLLVQFPSQGCLPMTACPSDGCCQWPLANCCQWPLTQAKALLPTAASAVWRGSCTGTSDGKGRGKRAG